MLFYHIFAIYSYDKHRHNQHEQANTHKKSYSVTTTRGNSTNNQHQTSKWTIGLHILTILFIISSFLTILMLTLNIWSLFPITYSCDTIVIILCTAFHISKSIFYAILIVRLQVAYGASAYGYSDCQIGALFVFVAIYSLIVCAGSYFVVYGAWLTQPHLWCHVHITENGNEAIGVLVWIGMDVMISFLLLYLFQIPIRKLLQRSKVSRRLANLMIKYSILTWIAILLSMTSLLLYLWKQFSCRSSLIECN